MPGVFDNKHFNAEAFKYVVDRIPDLRMNEMRRSRALRGNGDIREAFTSQNGTKYAVLAMRGLIDGEAVNYDGQTDITATSAKTFSRGVVVTGRAKGWIEKDFSYDITGGVDFMTNVAEQVSKYWETVDQDTLLRILSGIFSMSASDKDSEFVAQHTFDITGETTKTFGATTLNTATNRACGANKKKFTMAFMHSDVATNLENLNLLEYLKYTDPKGITTRLDIAQMGSIRVFIDDSIPLSKTVTTEAVNGVYTITIGTAGTEDDKISVGGVEYTFASDTSYTDKTIAVGTSSSTQATQLKKVLAEQFAGIFSVSSSSNTVVLTQIAPGTGSSPAISVTQGESGTIAASIATTTSGAAEVSETVYITYVLGDGAFDFEDIGAKVPYEMDRDPAKNGGQDTLYTRQRKVYAPYGISYTMNSQATDSPSDEELMMGANWELVHSGEASADQRSYINHKAIPICRIITKG